jgi:DNA-directed RNA polymerase subunit alpha
MGLIPFQKPDKVVMQKASDFQGLFEFYPLEKGYGATIGNALRRVLLSSLEGFAITNVKINGVEQEFSTITGVVEDVVNIVLNLKQVRFKPITDEQEERIFVSLSGKDQFLAGDIGKASNNFKVLNPEQVVCHMEPSVKLELEITVKRGRGYVSIEENKPIDAPIGMITVDSIFSPIKHVQYAVENYRVGQDTDFEKLSLNIHTDGSIHPEDALKEAAKVLMQHFVLFSDDKITLDEELKKEERKVDEKFLQMRKLLKTPLTDLDLSVRAYNCLAAAGIKTLGELVQYDVGDLLKFRNFGKKSLIEIEELVREKGLTFGMDVVSYKLDQE